MREFLHEHRALLLKHARGYVRGASEIIPAEDVLRELELVLVQLEKAKGVTAASITSPDQYIRGIVKHACGRAKRRRKLVEQVAAGDDLHAVNEDLASLDGDLPEPPEPPTPEANEARALLDRIKERLSPRDALVFSLMYEDDISLEDVATKLSLPMPEVEAANEHVLHAAEELGIEGNDGVGAARDGDARR